MLSAALATFPTWAATWGVVPTLSVGETYTDNVSLTPAASKQSAWVTDVVPGISVAATGAGLRFKASYNPDITYGGGGQGDGKIFQRGNAIGTAELAKQLLFLDFGAKVDQYNVSLQGPLTTSNVNTTGNRATVATYSASPYLRHDFGSDVHAEARFTGSMVNSDDQSRLPNSTSDRVDLRLNSGPAYKLLTWNLDYLKGTIDDGNEQDKISTEVVSANAKRLITPTVGLLAQAGYDSYKIGAISPPLEGASWSAGFDWTPSPRTRFAATAGRRFYGDDYFLDFSHRTRLTTWSAGYSHYVTSTRSEFFVLAPTTSAGYLNTLFSSQYPDPVARQKAVEEYISRTGLPPSLSGPTNFFSNQLFLAKRWQASAGILGVRNVLIANVFKERREALGGNLNSPGTGDFAASNTIDQTGTSFQWNWRITGQSAFNLGASYSRNEFSGTSRVDNVKYVGMGISRQFEPRLTGSLNYRRQQNDSSESAGAYTENAVFGALQMRF